MKILTVSSANMDINMKVAQAPVKGQTVLGDSYAYVPGGKGANSATTIAKLGGNSFFCTALGNDSNGKALLENYNLLGINTEHILVLDEINTGLATVTVESDGANRIVVFSGANAHLSSEHAVASLCKCMPDAVFCHFEIPYRTVCDLSHQCSKLNIPLFIDAGPADPSMDLSKLAPVFTFSPNETETEIFTGIAPTDDQSCIAAAKKLSTLVKAKYYVLKLGSRGCGVYDGVSFKTFPTYPIKVVDTTAAGDSFTAALTLEYMKTGDIERACRYGNAVATLTVSKQGAATSIPTEKELAQYINNTGITL